MDDHVDQEEADQVEGGQQVQGRQERRHLYKESFKNDIAFCRLGVNSSDRNSSVSWMSLFLISCVLDNNGSPDATGGEKLRG